MKQSIVLLLIGLFLFPVWAMADNSTNNFLQLGQSQKTELGLTTTSLGGFGISNSMVGHGILTYFDSESEGDTLALDLGGGAAYRLGANFFIGGGWLFGYNWDDSDLKSSFYPEVGIALQFTKTLGVMVSGKRYYKLYDGVEDEDVIMFSLLLGGS